ncbi:MAG: YbbR-like domain-containing protein [Anaerolineae bacterium]
MLRSILDNLGSALLALALAIMVWVVAVNEVNPPREGHFPDGGLPIEVVNTPEGLVLFDPVNERVTVTIRGPQSSWENLRPTNFRAYVDLAGLPPGLHDVEVQIKCAECAQKLVSILDKEPAQITVRLETFKEKKVKVQVHVLDSPPLGYTVGMPTTTPREVTVSGPQSQVDQVAELAADMFLQGAKTPVEQQVRVFARDNQGKAVAKVTISPAVVTVNVPVVQRLGYKEVTIRPITEGTVAPGYWLSNIVVEPSTVTIRGNPARVEEVPGFLETEPIDVNEVHSTFEKRVGLVVPEGISLLSEDQSVLVRIEVSAVMSGQTVERELILRGLALGMEATVSPQVVQVILSGPVPELQALEPEDVQVILDLAGLGLGTHKVTPTVVKPESLKVESMVPDTVEVTIALVPTPTPTITPTPTPRPPTPTPLPPTPTPTPKATA